MDAAPAKTDHLPLRAKWGALHRPSVLRLEILDRRHPERRHLQRFIAETFVRVYGAHIAHYAEQLVGLRDAAGNWAAGLGYTLAGRDRLFVEQYLDGPVEDAIASTMCMPVERHHIVEVGNLAAPGSGAARQLIVCMTSLLHELSRTWVVFTSTRALLNSFARLQIPTVALGRADPRRLPDGGKSWGNYYTTDPHVMTANIPLGLVRLGAESACHLSRSDSAQNFFE